MKKNSTKRIKPNPNRPTEPSKEDSLIIVAIGASAGGLESLNAFFFHSMPNPDIAFVIITHLSPDHTSALPELLQKHTPIKVLSISHQQKVEGNHIYVLPPGKKVAIHHGVLQLIERGIDPHVQLPIDFFFSSLAQDQSNKVICIILSGMGQDGTVGLRELRKSGALVIAQTAKSARYDGMPKSAINTGLVDYVLPPEDMYAFIIKYIAHLKDNSIPIEDNITKELHKILLLVKQQTGHDFSLYKLNTIYRRTQKRLSILHINTLSEYVYYLYQHPNEINILFKELLINVTSFFRDPPAFELLKKILQDKILFSPLKNKPLRVWVPACSTGQEAYSIAIILSECLDALKLNIPVQIFGTDIDEDAIEVARSGIFSTEISCEVSPERLAKFFIKENNSYKINADIRKMIIFAVQDLVKDPPFTRIDLLSCRNLLIYLSAELQKKILPLLHYSLNPDGLLFLGTSETLGGSTVFFNVMDKKWKIFKRKQGRSSFISTKESSCDGNPLENYDVKITEQTMSDLEPNLSNLIKNILLKYYTPACVVIDEKGTIVYVHGRTGRFLEFASGEVKLLFQDMIRPELKTKIQKGIHISLESQKEIVLNNLQLKEDNGMKHIQVKIRPVVKTEFYKGQLLLIIFEKFLSPLPKTKKEGTAQEDKKATQLEQELKYTKENLQTTIEELETSNEELKSSNEELQSTNEELQSTNEEIETSKEELQSLNEELSTVNAELESRIEQLSTANDDIKNLLDNTQIATIFLDKNLCIKRFTPKATEIINLIPTDIGRPVSHIVSNLKYDKLIEDAKTVLQTQDPLTTEGLDKDGHWYVIRLIPYRTLTNNIEGVVITFLNIHSQKEAENKLCELEQDLNHFKECNAALINALPQAAIIVDKDSQIVLANTLFYEQFKIKNNDSITGISLTKLKLDWDMNGLHSIIDKMMSSEQSLTKEPITRKSNETLFISARKISSLFFLMTLSSNDAHD